jgi:hypothetical protein
VVAFGGTVRVSPLGKDHLPSPDGLALTVVEELAFPELTDLLKEFLEWVDVG